MYKSNMNRRNQIIIIVLILIIGGIYYYTRTKTDFAEATRIIDDFYSCVMLNDTYATEPLYHQDFLEVSNIDDTCRFITMINSKLGEIVEYKNENINMKSYTGTDGSYIKVELEYSVTRTKYDSKETFVLLKEDTGYFIYGYNVNSIGLIE